MTLRDIVFRELDTATDDNGYTLDLQTAEELRVISSATRQQWTDRIRRS